MIARLRLADVGWILVTNLFVLAGVVVWGWPPGNVFLLFWVENAVLGVATAVRIATAEGVGDGSPPAPDSIRRFPRWGQVAFFTVHYGLFAVVHLVFVAILAVAAGTSWGFWALGLPALLIALRYVTDLASGWFIGRRRFQVTSEQAFWSPYPRLAVLHVATLLGFFLVLPFAPRQASWLTFLGPFRSWLDALGRSGNGMVLVALLMLLKTIADLVVLRRDAARSQPAGNHAAARAPGLS